MLTVQITGNFDKLNRNLAQMATRLEGEMGAVLMQKIDQMVTNALQGRFDLYDAKHRGSYSKAYGDFKDAINKPVGVVSGRTKEAVLGGSGGYVELKKTPLGFDYTRGIRESAFERGYPKFFAKWLQDRGDDLMALSDIDFAFIADAFFEHVEAILRK